MPILALWSTFGTDSRRLRAIFACHKERYFLSTLRDDSSQTRLVAHVYVLVHNLPHATLRCRLEPHSWLPRTHKLLNSRALELGNDRVSVHAPAVTCVQKETEVRAEAEGRDSS